LLLAYFRYQQILTLKQVETGTSKLDYTNTNDYF
jgi:hypothetical protein